MSVSRSRHQLRRVVLQRLGDSLKMISRRKEGGVVVFQCGLFNRKNETDFTSILSQYLCKMADLITKSGDI